MYFPKENINILTDNGSIIIKENVNKVYRVGAYTGVLRNNAVETFYDLHYQDIKKINKKYKISYVIEM